ncbi:MAG: SprT-like domain-containing protein [Verrucomicrobia bacterium]|nr:SprT-like domain-containing protein [Verrucomicrobiota bacterium]
MQNCENSRSPPGATQPFRMERRASPFNQLEFCFVAPSLPSAGELRELAAALLRGTGEPQLAGRVRVSWNRRMRTTVGRAEPARLRIILNPALRAFGHAEIERTVRHELAHLLAQHRARRRRILPHGKEWRQACSDLGIPGEPACHKLPLPARRFVRRYVYRCGHCGEEFPRVRRIRRAIACLACCRRYSTGNYDERYRLQPIKTCNCS